MAPMQKRSFFTVYQCGNATLSFHRYIFQVISQRKLVQSEHYQQIVRVYQVEYLIFAGADQHKFSFCSVQGRSVRHKPFAQLFKVVRQTRLNQMQIRTGISNVAVINIHSWYAERQTVGQIVNINQKCKRDKDRSLWHTTFKSGEVRETTVN